MGNLEQLTDDIMELRQEINELSGKMMQAKSLFVPDVLTASERETIERARVLIQRLIASQEVK